MLSRQASRTLSVVLTETILRAANPRGAELTPESVLRHVYAMTYDPHLTYEVQPPQFRISPSLRNGRFFGTYVFT